MGEYGHSPVILMERHGEQGLGSAQLEGQLQDASVLVGELLANPGIAVGKDYRGATASSPALAMFRGLGLMVQDDDGYTVLGSQDRQ